MKSALLFLVTLTLTQASRPAPALPDIAAAAARYERGEHAAALTMLTGSRLTSGALTAGLDRCPATGDAATASRRRIIAVTLALDTVWSATRAAVAESPARQSQSLGARRALGTTCA